MATQRPGASCAADVKDSGRIGEVEQPGRVVGRVTADPGGRCRISHPRRRAGSEARAVR
jgi:hypothetical protein